MTRVDRMRMAVQLPLEGARQPGSVVIASLTVFHTDTARELHRIGGRHNIRCLSDQGGNQTGGGNFMSISVYTRCNRKCPVTRRGIYTVCTPEVDSSTSVGKQKEQARDQQYPFHFSPPVKSDYSPAGFLLYPWQRPFRIPENDSWGTPVQRLRKEYRPDL